MESNEFNYSYGFVEKHHGTPNILLSTSFYNNWWKLPRPSGPTLENEGWKEKIHAEGFP